MKELLKFTQTISFDFDEQKIQRMTKALNLHYLGDEECNEYRDGKLVAKYPEGETKELHDATWRVRAGKLRNIEVTMFEDGSTKAKFL